MKNFILIIILAIAMSGCANRLHVQCSDCTINNDEFSCNGCQVEAVASRYDGDVLEIIKPIFTPKPQPK